MVQIIDKEDPANSAHIDERANSARILGCNTGNVAESPGLGAAGRSGRGSGSLVSHAELAQPEHSLPRSACHVVATVAQGDVPPDALGQLVTER